MSEKKANKITFWINKYIITNSGPYKGVSQGPLFNMSTEDLELLVGEANDILCERANSVLKEVKQDGSSR